MQRHQSMPKMVSLSVGGVAIDLRNPASVHAALDNQHAQCHGEPRPRQCGEA